MAYGAPLRGSKTAALEEGSDMIKGFSFIWGKDVFYCGRYAKGYWFDSNDVLKKPEGGRTGFGIKFDVAIGKIIRPVPYFWKLGFWRKDKPVIQDILDEGEDYAREFFGGDLYDEIMLLSPHHWEKRTVWNPWYALHRFVLRTPSFIWPSFSIGTPWLSFHVGSKAAQIDPFTRDLTWCGRKEERLALLEEPQDRFYALAISATLRKKRVKFNV